MSNTYLVHVRVMDMAKLNNITFSNATIATWLSSLKYIFIIKSNLVYHKLIEGYIHKDVHGVGNKAV